MSAPRIAIVDYRMGNLRSVEKGFEHAGVDGVRVTQDAADVAGAAGIVLPGVGAFADAAANLRESGLRDVIIERVADGTPFFGICLGMQLLADIGYEEGESEGLGIVSGTCERLSANVKVPHIGWNTVEYTHESPLFDGVPSGSAFYFVHSYRLLPSDSDVVSGDTEYGVRFASAVQQGENVFAVQFHPEKSSTLGLKLLGNFGRIVGDAAR